MSTPFQLIIQTNSPGELTTWVHPIIQAFSKKVDHLEVTIALTPCQYASGNEVAVASAYPFVKTVWSPKETISKLKSWLKKEPISRGCLFFLGGDPLYSKLLRYKFGIPAYAYTNHKAFPEWGYDHVFYSHDVGDLMADRVVDYLKSAAPTSVHDALYPPYTVFLSGSRPIHFDGLFPYWIKTIKHIQKSMPDFRAVLPISPFITEDRLNKLKKDIPEGVLLTRLPSLDCCYLSEMVVTLPGSNNSEMLYLRKPCMVFLPTQYPKLLIFDGLMEHIGKIPILGIGIKKSLIAFLKTQKRFYSLPNIMAKQEIMPEIVGDVTPLQASEHIIRQWTSLKDYDLSGYDALIPDYSVSDRMVSQITL